MAFVAAFLEEWLDGFGKDSGVSGVLLLFLGVFLDPFSAISGIPVPTALGFIPLEFIPCTRASHNTATTSRQISPTNL